MITTDKVRNIFINFFKAKNHRHIHSAPLVPKKNDQSLLFTNAGMVQFKDIFLGVEKPNDTRVVTIQKCIRAGGKHNDLDNVGYTARHHTFFEMLGNFSFGDYFKAEAIQFAWEFLTKELRLPTEKLWITVFEQDIESEEIWLKKIGINPKRFLKVGGKDNFWSMGETGPCGPCTEIFYDHGPNVLGSLPGSSGHEGDRYVEIWNLVFMQYNRFSNGTMELLPQYAIDTGMGLERLAAILQDVVSNYDIDIFKQLIKEIAVGVKMKDLSHPSLRVIADHIRSCSFLIADGVIPSNEGSGYVLRRIIRRAVRHGYQLGINNTFFYKLVDVLIQIMGGRYLELIEKELLIKKILKTEEIQFRKTLSYGLKVFNLETQQLNNKNIPGILAFKLYDTYGFPLDLTEDLAKEKNMQVDIQGFHDAMTEQKTRAKKASYFSSGLYSIINLCQKSKFLGYSTLSTDAFITGIYRDNQPILELCVNENATVILNQTPFYGESGGQVGDVGEIRTFSGLLFQVFDTKKVGGSILHIGRMIKGQYRMGDSVRALVNNNKRMMISANHSATHLLHSALRQVIGIHIKQEGSLVEPDKLRFDFSHTSKLTDLEIKDIETVVNQVIRRNLLVKCMETTPVIAKKMGAIALFEEKYGALVRILKIGDFSMELCGGTHVQRTVDIGMFKITNQYSIATGIKRVEALTGQYAEDYINYRQDQLLRVHTLLKSTDENVLDKILMLQCQLKKQKNIIKQLKLQVLSSDSFENESIKIAGTTVISSIIDNVDAEFLRNKMDEYKCRKKNIVVVLATVQNCKPIIVVGVSQMITDKIHAVNLVTFIARQIGAKGGGRAGMAQAGGGNAQDLLPAISSVHDWVKQRL